MSSATILLILMTAAGALSASIHILNRLRVTAYDTGDDHSGEPVDRRAEPC